MVVHVLGDVAQQAKKGSKFNPFRAAAEPPAQFDFPLWLDVSFSEYGGQMSLFRLATFLVMCGITLSAVGKSGTSQKSVTKEAGGADDIPKSIAESVSGTLQFAEGNFIGLAEAMPEDKYSYVPAVGKFDGVRSFGEQVKHVACAQFAFFNEFEGKKPPEDCEKGGHDPAKTKAELIKYLKDSFDYSNAVLARLTANNALDRVEGRYAGPNTKLGISVVAIWHITDHYGQLVEYLRLNGIVPPMTQKYGLKVR